ncbi:MAG: Crp/Fnr family transcriptional regulator [Deltaproteobacteria bacterium]|nr:Crp/Fnr family transcriptional regulator [Deltaproteobacteria bacterium]
MINNNQLLQFKNAIGKVHLIDDECLSELQSISYYHKLEKNEYFSKEGQYNEKFGMIIDGIMRIFYLSKNGEEHNKYFCLANDFVTASIKPDKKSITNIQALTETTLVCLPYSKLIVLSEKFEQIRIFIQQLTLNYLEQKQKKEIYLLSNESIDNYLLFLKSYPGLINQIPHYHIASYLGITPTQLSRVRKKLEINRKHQHM